VQGYNVAEFFMLIGITYALITLLAVTFAIGEVLRKERGLKSGTLKKTLFIIGSYAIITAIYMLDIRIGSVMFVNGVLTAFIVTQLVEVGEQYGQEI
jgi:hypothetical protein